DAAPNTVTVDVTAVNDAPTDLSLSANTVAENAANGTTVGTVSGTDPDSGDTKTYSFTDSAGGRFAINSSTGVITVANSSLLNYEAATSHSVTVRVTDSGGLTYDETFTINLTNVNETPTDLTLSSSNVVEHAVNGTVVGTASTTDPDAGDSHTYQLTDDAGGRFAIDATTGQITVADGSLLHYEVAPTHDVTVRVTDSGGLTYEKTFTINLIDANDAPDDLVLSSNTVVENAANGTVIGIVTGNDVDAGDTLTYSFTDSAGGRFAINSSTGQITVADGSLLNYEATTNHSVTVRVTDNAGLTYDETFTINLTNSNEMPTNISLSSNTVSENAANGTVVGTASTTDPDAGDTHTYSLLDSAGGRFTIDANTGQITVADGTLLDYESATSHTIMVRTTDAGGLTHDQTLTINLTNVNEAPTFSNLADTPTYTEGGSPVVLDADVQLTDPELSVADNFNGSTLTLVRNGGTNAEDVFSATGTLSPLIDEGALIVNGITIGGVLQNANGTLILVFGPNATNALVNQAMQQIAYGNSSDTPPSTVQIDWTFNDGNSGGQGTGGALTATGSTTLTIIATNDAPVLTPVAPDVTFVENGSPQVVDATGTIVDPDSADFDGGILMVSISANGTADDRLIVGNFGTGPGQVGLSGNNVTYGGTVIGTVSGGTSGSDPLVITFNTSATPSAVQEVYRSIQFSNVSDDPSTATRQIAFDLTDGDGGAATPQTKLVYIQAVNDAPVNTVPGAQSVNEDTPLVISGLSVTDADGNLSSVQLAVSNGTLNVTLSGTASISAGANGSNTLTLMGSQADINAVLATLTYQGTLNFNGSDTLTVTSTDSNSVSDIDTVAITVTAVDDATVVTGGTSGTGNEDTIVTGTLTATDVEGLSDGTVFTVTGAASNGTASIDPSTGLWSYTPNADFNGSDSFTVTITDDAGNTTTQVISVTVTAVVDITDDSLTTTEDTAISANVLTGTNGATADSFEGTSVLTSVTQGANGTVAFLANGTVTYTPNANFNGTDSFTYTITSGGVTETATVTVTVTAVDDPTVVTGGTSGTGNEDTTLTGTLTATDNDGLSDGTVFTVTGVATNGTASIDPATGLWSYTPNADYNGSDSFTVTITDDAGNTTTQVISVTVTPVNDAPLLSTNTGSTVAEGGTDTIDASELAVTDVEQAAAQLTYTIGTGPLYGRLELTTAPGVNATAFTQADIAANRLLYVHDGSETTSDSFTFTVNDAAGGSLGLTTVTLTITPVNDAPTITSSGGGATAAISVGENVSAVTVVTGADVDLPAQALSYSISGGVDQALFTINAATGALRFTAPPDFEVATDANGDNVYVVQVQVVDSQGASTTQTVQVTVTDVVESVAPPPVVPPILLTPIPPPSSGGPTSGPGAPPADEPVTVSDPTTVPPGPTVPPMVGPPVNVVPLTLVPPSERPVERVPEEPRKTEEDAKDRPLFFVNDDQGRPLYSVLPVEPAPTLEPEPPETTPSVSDLLMAKLDEMAVSLEQAVNVSQERHELMARVAAVTGTTLSVGFVAWALRSGAILASMLATMPAWQHFDPLPVVKLTRNERKHRRDEATRAQQQEAAEFKGLNQVLDKAPPLKRTA
ncbi:beta strand repeat-containing protein, partial [Nitrospira sp. BLG_1]|uniref:beta strand repeat-containing protein n=1 Tax=Nitrospira sp. BLG_1 TaxID=3395883 RepID=UPI0039BCE10C